MTTQEHCKSQNAHPSPLKSALSGVLQRKCACGQHTIAGGECEACQMKEMMLQRRANSRGESAAAPPIVYEVLRSPGQPLDRATREYMSTRFNGNFSRVATQSQ